MTSIFGKRHKSPAEIVKALKEAIVALEKGEKKSERVIKKIWISDKLKYVHYVWFVIQLQEDVSKNLQAMKQVLYGSQDSEPQTELVAQLAHETYNLHLIPLIVNNLAKFDFEVSIESVL